MLLVIVLSQTVCAQSNSDGLATPIDKIAQQLEAIEKRLQTLEKRLDGLSAMAITRRDLVVPEIAVKSLEPHFDALRAVCNEPGLIITADERTNTLILLASSDAVEHIERAIRLWIRDGKNGDNPIFVGEAQAPVPPMVDPHLPSQREFNRRMENLKHLIPGRYEAIDEPRNPPKFLW